MSDDDVRAAAERLLDNDYRLGLDDQRAQDIQTVASYALEAGQEVTRLREESHRFHVTELMMSARERIRIPEMDDCPRCAALSTPGEHSSEDG